MPPKNAWSPFGSVYPAVTVLDPACGSGNFLYVALRSLLDLEKEIIDYAAGKGWHGLHPQVKPDQMHGLEIDPYAAELARHRPMDWLYPMAPVQRIRLQSPAHPVPAEHYSPNRRHPRRRKH